MFPFLLVGLRSPSRGIHKSKMRGRTNPYSAGLQVYTIYIQYIQVQDHCMKHCPLDDRQVHQQHHRRLLNSPPGPHVHTVHQHSKGATTGHWRHLYHRGKSMIPPLWHHDDGQFQVDCTPKWLLCWPKSPRHHCHWKPSSRNKATSASSPAGSAAPPPPSPPGCARSSALAERRRARRRRDDAAADSPPASAASATSYISRLAMVACSDASCLDHRSTIW